MDSTKEKTKSKKHPITIAFLVAILIGIVCGIIYFKNYYQPELALPPRLVVRDNSGELCELLLTSYDWTYKGVRQTYNMGLTGKEIGKYDYNIKNILFSDVFFYNNSTVIATDPNFKNNGFIVTTYEYMPGNLDLYEDNLRTDVEKIQPSEEFWFGSISYGTNYNEITLNSDKQGMATYIFKSIETANFALDKLKTAKLTNADDVKKFFSEESGGQFLKDVKIEGNKIKLDYEYFMQKDVISDYACEIFALMDNINEIEYNFLHNKYLHSKYNYDTDETEMENFDKAEPVIYKRDGFKTYYDVSIKELQDYIKK